MTSLSKQILLLVACILIVIFLSPTNFSFSIDKDKSYQQDDKKALPAAAKIKIDFVKHIQPIFQKKCISCHGSEESESGLRLDNKKSAFDGGDNGKIIISGKSAKSLLIHAVAGLDEDLQMPPEDEGTPLTQEQIALLRAWIDQGAHWPDGVDGDIKLKGANHWAFQPIKNPVIPKLKSKWIRNEIDAFILAKLQAEKIKPSLDAPRHILIRRVYLDLIGLPPTPKEYRKWQNNKRTNWYECLVDDLLKSSHYGERWGRLWLDQARYADSDGYEQDRTRPHAWRWRDWVINAINEDQPFDQFTIDQLAGDLRPNATLKQKIATGFQRNTLINREEGSDQEEDRVKRTVDRTNTIGKVWLGLTLECAQCHTHKYDPLTQREYYRFYAFFNNLREPDISAASEQQKKQYQLALQVFNQAHEKITKAMTNYKQEKLAIAQAKWEKVAILKSVHWQTIKPRTVTASSQAKLKVLPDLSILAQGVQADKEIYTWTAQTDLTSVTAIKLEVLPDASLGKNGPGRAKHGNFVLTGISVNLKTSTENKPLQIQTVQASFSQRNWHITSAIDGNTKTGWAISPQYGKPQTAILQLKQPIKLKGKSIISVQLKHEHGGNHTIGRFRISLTDRPLPKEYQSLPRSITKLLHTPLNHRTEKQKQELRKYYTSLDKELKKLQQTVQQHLKKKPTDPSVKFLAQAVAERSKTRQTKIHIRGDFLRKGDVVESGIPLILPPLKMREKKADRIDLANWLMNPKNPLTARVIVNRVWQQYFGRGIVATSHDFGTQGEKPSHPELLDWLATRFRKNGWSFKALHRLIVTSSTYRQTSLTRNELKERDPYNSWLAYQNRIRVEAETIRDLALAASGLLSPKVGGPSVYPPQAKGVSSLAYPSKSPWKNSAGEDRYRRGLYTFFQRTVPYPMLMTFDAPDSSSSCTKRDRSNTPLQALTLWNDPVFFECAQHLGARIVSDVAKQDSPQKTNLSRLEAAFIRCFSRTPEKEEQRDILAFLNLQYRIYKTNKKLTTQIIGSVQVPQGIDPAELAAWIAVARTMMNFDEFITKE